MLKINEVNQICSMVKTCCGKQVNTAEEITVQDLEKTIDRIKKRHASKDAEQLAFLNEALNQVNEHGTLLTASDKELYKNRLIIASHISNEELEKKQNLYRYVFTANEMAQILANDAGGNSVSYAKEFYKYLQPFAGSRNAEILRKMLSELSDTSYAEHRQALQARDQKAAEARRSIGVGADNEQAIREGWIKEVELFKDEPNETFKKLIQTAKYPEVCAVIGPDIELKSADDYKMAIQSLTADLQGSDPTFTQIKAQKVLDCAAEIFGAALPEKTGGITEEDTALRADVIAYFAGRADDALNEAEKLLTQFDHDSQSEIIHTVEQCKTVKNEYNKIYGLLDHAKDQIGEHTEPVFQKLKQRHQTLSAQLLQIVNRETPHTKELIVKVNSLAEEYLKSDSMYISANEECLKLTKEGEYGPEQQAAYNKAASIFTTLDGINKNLLGQLTEIENNGLSFLLDDQNIQRLEYFDSAFQQTASERQFLLEWSWRNHINNFLENSKKPGIRRMACLGTWVRIIGDIILLILISKDAYGYMNDNSGTFLIYTVLLMIVGTVCFLIGCRYAGAKMGEHANGKTIRTSYVLTIVLFWIIVGVLTDKLNAMPKDDCITFSLVMLVVDGGFALFFAHLGNKVITLGFGSSNRKKMKKIRANQL